MATATGLKGVSQLFGRDFTEAQIEQATNYQGIIANQVVHTYDQMYVLIDSIDGGAALHPVAFTPDATLPTKGSKCLISHDDTGLAWLVAWSPTA